MFPSLFFLMVLGCDSPRKTVDNSKQSVELRELYEVMKIDSVENVYLIYAKKQTKIYKIASIKDSVADCKVIKVGARLPFVLHPLGSAIVNDVTVYPDNIPHLNAIDFHGVSIKLENSSQRKIFIAFNIKSNCFQ